MFNFAHLKLLFHRQNRYNFDIKRYQRLQEIQGIFLRKKIGGKCFVTHSKIVKSAKSMKMVSNLVKSIFFNIFRPLSNMEGKTSN